MHFCMDSTGIVHHARRNSWTSYLEVHAETGLIARPYFWVLNSYQEQFVYLGYVRRAVWFLF